MAPGPCLMHRRTAALLILVPASALRTPYFWCTASMHSPLPQLVDQAMFGATSRPSRQTATKIFPVIASSSILQARWFHGLRRINCRRPPLVPVRAESAMTPGQAALNGTRKLPTSRWLPFGAPLNWPQGIAPERKGSLTVLTRFDAAPGAKPTCAFRKTVRP